MAPRLPLWVEPYLGAPYSDDGKAGCFNCWTLFAHVQRAVFGVDIADYDGPIWAGRAGAKAMGEAAEAFAARFSPVASGHERAGDAVLLRVSGVPVHIGVVVTPGWMLHTNARIDACVESYRSALWRARVVGFYRAEQAS